MFSIFNGKRRQLGKSAKQDIYIQISVDLRNHLARFKGARLSVLMCIALHADKDGWAYPSINTICRETGYNKETVYAALDDLCVATIDNGRLLLRHQKINVQRGLFESNRYLLLPSDSEVARWEKPKSPSRENPDTVKPSRNFPYTEKPCTENPDSKKNQIKREPDKEKPREKRERANAHVKSDDLTELLRTQSDEIFEFWQQATEHRLAKFSSKRKRRVIDRLKEGWTVHQIKLAIEGVAGSDFHRGTNDRQRRYDDLELICRDTDHIETYINLRAPNLPSLVHRGCDGDVDWLNANCKVCGASLSLDSHHNEWLKEHLETTAMYAHYGADTRPIM